MRFADTLMRLLVEARFRLAGADLELGPGAQIRSPLVRPLSGGKLVVGADSIFAGRMAMDRPNAVIHIGPRTFVGKGLLVAAERIEIGADVLMSWGVTVIDHQSHSLDFAKRAQDVKQWLAGHKDWSHVSIEPVRIGDKAWIGFGASILPGVNIGEGAVVGAQSVVTRDVEPWAVVAGNPAKVIRMLAPS